MLRFTQKFQCHAFPRKYGSSRFLSVKYPYSQKSNLDPARSRNNSDRESSSGGGGLFYTVGILSIASGATLVYAKYDNDFRKWISSQVPWSENVIEFIFQEKESWSKSVENVWDGVSQRAHDLIPSFSSKEVKKPDDGKKQDSVSPRSVFSALPSQTSKTSEKSQAEVLSEPSTGVQSYQRIVTGEREKHSEDAVKLPEVHPLNVAELEKEIQESAASATKSYHDAASAIQETSLDILYLVEQTAHQTDEKGLQTIKAKFEKKELLVRDAENRAQKAMDNLSRLKDLVQRENIDASESVKASALENINKAIEDVKAAKQELENEKRNASVAEKYWRKVEAARKHYIDELIILFPDVRLSEKDWRINKQDLDLFIYYCFQNVLYYQKELAKLETLRSEKLNAALRGSAETVDKSLLEATVADALERQQRELELNFQKRLLEIQQAADKEMRLQLKRQAEAHNDHLSDVVALREKELERKFSRDEEEKIAAEQNKFKHQLAGMMGRLQGLESALKARAHIDKGAHQAQVLWSACQALHCALKHAEPGVPWQQQLRPLENEITAVQKAALQDDELVKAVLDGIPEEAKKRGVFSEAALRERFLQVERSAQRVALVPMGGAPLPVYFLSYLQSSLLIKALNPIPEAELHNEPTSFEKLDTYDVLQRARYWMERGNIEQTLRYMNLLSGASRAVAQDWMSEARIFLETKQAANVLMTHAAAAGLLYV